MPGAWVGANVCAEKNVEVVLLTSQEKWDCLKTICRRWLKLLEQGVTELDYKQLLYNRGFMVHGVFTQAYPRKKPYLKGFHLSLEMWWGGRDNEGWKLPAQGTHALVGKEEALVAMSKVKLSLLIQTMAGSDMFALGPPRWVHATSPTIQGGP
jgi:hypothetical protein